MTSTRSAPGVRTIAAVLVLGALAPLLDTTIVYVALGTLGRELNAPLTTVQWVGTGYLLAGVAAIPVTAWAVDRFGARRMWLLALLVFGVGSALCATAWDVGALIAFRVLQGVGAGLMLPILQTLLVRAAGGQGLGRLMAVVTLPALAGPILGPVVGGLIVGHASWRWIFLVNVPICAAAFLLARWRLPADGDTGRLPLDGTGLVLLVPGATAVVYGLSGLAAPTVATVWLPLALGVGLVGAFVRHALGTPSPLLDVRLFARRGFAASAVLLFLSGFGLFGSMALLPMYYEQLRGAGVVAAGLLLAPQGLGSLLARGFGSLTDRIGARPVVLVGVALSVAGTVPFALSGAATPLPLLAVALVVRGLGTSAANLAVMAGAFDGLDRAEVAHASTAIRIVQQVGGTFGTAALAVVLAAGAPAGPQVAFAGAFWWTVAFAAVAAVPALVLPRRGVSPAAAPAPSSTGRPR